ncbi:MAG: Ni/Fe hydrogenase subunit gamma [Pirellulaceae bacterium]|nr:MAG: Ni/Fe hydrogenase subunit gamma [Pirellulaceae bacterium]
MSTAACAGVRPDSAHPWVATPATIVRIDQEVPGVATYYLELCDEKARSDYRFQPGQFNMLYLPGAGEIAISVSGDPAAAGPYAHTIRRAGNVTGSLWQLKVGDKLGIRGPFGSGWPLGECQGRDVVLVAGGIGLAPLRPVIYSLSKWENELGRRVLLCGARSPETLLYHSQYLQWIEAGWQVETTVDRASPDWNGHVGAVTLLLERLRSVDASRAVLFCCGPEVMMKFSAMVALRRGWSADRIWISMERNMQCAVGWCGHCQWGPAFICRDGPVFRYDRIAPFLDVPGL